MTFTPTQVAAAVAQHGTVFFDAQLNPVVPQAAHPNPLTPKAPAPRRNNGYAN